jgi:predicted NBD/HSP70 family sugar kinase
MPEQTPHAALRWHGAARLIAVMRAEPGITRAAAAQRLGIGTSGATALVERMRRTHLVDESPAPVTGRGRPTTVLGPHAAGPLAVAVDLAPHSWRLATAGLDGTPVVLADGHYPRSGIGPALSRIAGRIGELCEEQSPRVCAISVAVAGTVSGSVVTQFTSRGWTDVDLSVLGAEVAGDLPLLFGNDATLAALAEARTGAARDATTALHLIVTVGIGGALVVDGRPLTGAHGAAGEYGHVPLGDPNLPCPCGARGCWDVTVDGRALARHRGDPPPDDPVAYTRALLDRADRDDLSRNAFDKVSGSLGRGIAGLVNLHDPDIVTVGGLAAQLRSAAPAAFDDAYLNGLMAFRRAGPPPVRTGRHGEDGPLRGAIIHALDHATTADALAVWAARRR